MSTAGLPRNPLYVTGENEFVMTSIISAPPGNTNAATCTPKTLYEYQKQLEAWNACQYCGRAGYGSMKTPDGRYVCDVSAPKAGALASCPAGPVNTCYPFMTPLSPDNPWTQQQRYSWGASVFDPKYGKYILYNTWNEREGRPYFSEEAPYMRGGQNAPC